MAAKTKRRNSPVVNYSIKSNKDVVLNELGTRHVSQLFRVALAVHTFATREECIR